MSSSNQDQTTSSNDTSSNLNEILSNCSSELHKQLFEKIHGISSIFNITYALSPKLKYEYPPINNIIIENIVAALIACPKFYTQTLHLMNKMNLPCPLVPFVRIKRPSLSHNQATVPSVSSLNDKSSEMDIDLPPCQSESEVESDTENSSSQLKLTKNKRNNDSSTNIQQVISPKKVKLKSLIKSIQIKSTKGYKKVESVEDAFEKLTDTFQKTSKKPASFCTKTTETENILYKRAIVQSEFEGFAKIVPNLKQSHIDENKNVSEIEETNIESNEFISKKMLESSRLKISELKEMPVFKNYDRGECNTRIYVKNLGKKVQEKDLKFIYGRYIEWSNPIHVNAFDIRLMQEGRMKGQAFITLPNEQIAERALNETLGYVLDEKPIIVQFARSAKPK